MYISLARTMYMYISTCTCIYIVPTHVHVPEHMYMCIHNVYICNAVCVCMVEVTEDNRSRGLAVVWRSSLVSGPSCYIVGCIYRIAPNFRGAQFSRIV